jgi:hypothetical protein
VKHPVTWALVACAIGSTVLLILAATASDVRWFNVVAMASVLLACVILLATGAGASAEASASRLRIIASQFGLVVPVALGIYLLVRGREIWPGILLLVLVGLIELALIVKVRQGLRER